MTQAEALNILKTGANVFLTGEPGAGKTHALNTYVDYLKKRSVDVAVTASTGIAATHINGMTIHAWSGIGIKSELSPYDLDQITSREKVVKRVSRAQVLVIDEISMLDGRTLSMVEQVVRMIKGTPEPFGGMQVVLVGDFFQLPPITGKGTSAQFACETPVWHGMRPLICYLSEQYRQDDATLLSLLSSLRKGTVDESVYDVISSCKNTSLPDGTEATRLFTHNVDVDRINTEHLAQLDGDVRRFEMTSRGPKLLVETIQKSCLSPEILELKIGAMVMCTKNNFEVGYVNGTLGHVIGYDEKNGHPIIQTFSGEEMVISPNIWTIAEGDKVLAEVSQIPLRLAWAITVHKSQGMTLDAAEIDLSNAFEYGQGYVALSRVRTLGGLVLSGCNARALEVHPRVLELDADLHEESEAAREAFTEMATEERERMHKRFIEACGGTWNISKDTAAKAHYTEKDSTLGVTQKLLKKELSLADIAEKRDLKTETIVSHIEKLLHAGAITKNDIAYLRPGDENGKTMFAELTAIFKEHGTEKLKPIHTAADGRYTYDDIRFARLFVL